MFKSMLLSIAKFSARAFINFYPSLSIMNCYIFLAKSVPKYYPIILVLSLFSFVSFVSLIFVKQETVRRAISV